jgi:5'-methylthioadenosine phosphorylase
MWAIIGGSGFEKNTGYTVIKTYPVKTPFGKGSADLQHIRVAGIESLYLSRHGIHHQLLPSEINFRANIYALKERGVTKILSVSSVGSLQSGLKPGELVVPTQYIDKTKGLRKHTFLGEGITGHVSLADPTSLELTAILRGLANEFDFTVHFDKTYLCIEGPYYSSRAESQYYRNIGGQIIGMTNFPEYALAREAGMYYLPCCMITDYDCWNEVIPPVTLKMVAESSTENRNKIMTLIEGLFPRTAHLFTKGCPELGLKKALLSHLTAKQRKWLNIILS